MNAWTIEHADGEIVITDHDGKIRFQGRKTYLARVHAMAVSSIDLCMADLCDAITQSQAKAEHKEIDKQIEGRLHAVILELNKVAVKS